MVLLVTVTLRAFSEINDLVTVHSRTSISLGAGMLKEERRLGEGTPGCFL